MSADITILFGRPHVAPDGEDRFELEALAAEELGIESYAIPLDPIVNRDPERALRRLPRARDRRWLYRGWMLNEEEYTSLYEAIADRGEEMVVDPESFAEATYAQGRLVAHAPYLDVDSVLEDPHAFDFLGRTVSSPFFTADVARLASGCHTVIEINDGGCSVLPERLDPRDLYRAVAS